MSMFGALHPLASTSFIVSHKVAAIGGADNVGLWIALGIAISAAVGTSMLSKNNSDKK